MNYCPDCKTVLNPGSSSCICGWKESKDSKMIVRCDCGQPSRIIFSGYPKCWDCYHFLQIKMGSEDWRDEMIYEKQIELGLLPQGDEPDWSVAERAKKKLREMGGMGKMFADKTKPGP